MNKKRRYSIGIDFGTLSARAMLFSIQDGRSLAEAECHYPHGVMDTALPNGTPIPPDWALQCPDDYLFALDSVLPQLASDAGVDPTEIVGIGVDFTSCTVLPVRQDGMPLCLLPEFSSNPHAYVKLWKHHGAKRCADKMSAVAIERDEPWLAPCG